MILCVVGPTAVGKTKLSLELAKKYNAIIVNCDAMQVFKGLDIGTAKIKPEEMEGIPHELIDFVDVNYNYTVFDYQKDARNILEKYKNRNIIFVGGTGLYLKATLYDYRFSSDDNNKTYDGYSNEELYKLALKKDKNCSIHVNNRKRLIRFLNKKDVTIVKPEKLYDFILIGLTTDRDTLYKKINERVDKMISAGLVEEVKKFYDLHIRSKALLTGIGYKEIYSYLDNNISLEEAISLIKKNSRHYAKRQYTWFNNQMDVKWFNTCYDDFNKTILDVENYIESK